MKILSHNPGHDGAIAFLQDARLMMSIEAEKDSNARYSPISIVDVVKALGDIDEIPDVICTGGWWPRDHYEYLHGSDVNAGYRGVAKSNIIVAQQRFLGKQIQCFSSSHERSHLLSAFGLSSLPTGTPCYALVWEGAIGAFYEIDSELNITLVGDVLDSPGNRYSQPYGLADPTFPKDGPFPRVSDAGKLMALASFSNRSKPTAQERKLLDFLLTRPLQALSAYEDLEHAPHLNVGVDDPEFRNFAGIYSDAIFDIFYQFAKAKFKKKQPLLIAGGCGLNCDWNSKWKESGLFTDVFVPPVANDSGSAIGTAIDAQFHFTGNPKIDWDVYSGHSFSTELFDLGPYDVYETNYEFLADLLANDLILGWVSGKYEIGPRALGNRSILAAPFHDNTRVRLNEIKQREQFRPIAPVCLEDDAAHKTPAGSVRSPHTPPPKTMPPHDYDDEPQGQLQSRSYPIVNSRAGNKQDGLLGRIPSNGGFRLPEPSAAVLRSRPSRRTFASSRRTSPPRSHAHGTTPPSSPQPRSASKSQ